MALPRYYKKEHLKKIQEVHLQMQEKTNDLVILFTRFIFSSEKAGEYARHGFARRIQVLSRCIQNIFRIIPAGTVKVPKRERLHDATINLQAFYANAFGCVDNLAWVWVHESGLASRIRPREVGLRKSNARVRKTLSPEFQAFLASRDKWFEYLTEFRHALGHRVPPYIPPGSVRPKDQPTFQDLEQRMRAARSPGEFDSLLEEQKQLYIFEPLTIHSFDEATGTIRFHQQMLVDFLTVEEIALKMLDELRAIR